MKRLDIVTVLFNGTPESPGIVSSVDFTTEGEQFPSLTVAFLLPTGGAHIIRSIPHESGIEAAYKWREYSAADFPDAPEPEAVPSTTGADLSGNQPPVHSEQTPA